MDANRLQLRSELEQHRSAMRDWYAMLIRYDCAGDWVVRLLDLLVKDELPADAESLHAVCQLAAAKLLELQDELEQP